MKKKNIIEDRFLKMDLERSELSTNQKKLQLKNAKKFLKQNFFYYIMFLQ